MFDFEYIKQDPEAVGQVIGAIIGVTGLFIGTFITILTSFIVRYMDIKREERKELSSVKKAKKEKEFYLKQEIYSKFISELASFENFLTKKASNLSVKNLDNFDDEWTRTEIKVELIASPKVSDLKDRLSEELINLAEAKFSQKDSSKELSLSETYMSNRTALLEAIRQDMEINV
jgi:hypothetical protein